MKIKFSRFCRKQQQQRRHQQQTLSDIPKMPLALALVIIPSFWSSSSWWGWFGHESLYNGRLASNHGVQKFSYCFCQYIFFSPWLGGVLDLVCPVRKLDIVELIQQQRILQKTSLKVEWKSCDRARSPRAPPAPRLLLPPTKMRSIPKLNFKRQLASVNSSIFKIYPQSEYRKEYTTAWQSIEVIYFFLSLFVSTLPPWGEGGEKKEVLILPGTEGLAGGWLMGEQNKNSTGSSNLSLPKLYPPPPVILCLREIFWV